MIHTTFAVPFPAPTPALCPCHKSGRIQGADDASSDDTSGDGGTVSAVFSGGLNWGYVAAAAIAAVLVFREIDRPTAPRRRRR